MVDILELQYATMLSSRLERFSIKSRNPLKINFRCPICLDSQQSKSKARGWLLEDKSQSLHFFCHNCGASQGFHKFLKGIDQLAYNEFIAEKYIKKIKPAEPNFEQFKTKPPIFDSNPLKKIKCVIDLKSDHPISKYLVDRKIPEAQYSRLFYAPKFMTWINTLLPDKFPDFKSDHPRLILPFLDKEGKLFGCSARGFDPKGLRYISIMLDDRSKVFGLDKVDFTKPYFIVEGAIDSIFLSNAIAMAGADGSSKGLNHPENAIWIFDAEQRNKEIQRRMEKLIDQGKKLCIWPDNMPGKDINDFILSGMSAEKIEQIIFENTFSGLQARMQLTRWRKT